MELKRYTEDGVTLVGGEGAGVRFGFTERTGGVSQPPFASLNLGAHVDDDPAAVAENRRRVLKALGAGACADRLVTPNQVHGDHVVTVTSAAPEELARVRAEAAAGADAVVCAAPGVPVMLMFADCVPVVIVAPGAFAVAHSGWKGTYAGIAGKTARALCAAAGCVPEELEAFIGPHILGSEYEVSQELLDRFAARFSSVTAEPDRLLDLSAAIAESLEGADVPAAAIHDTGLSTLSQTDRFFSYRAEGGVTGRHAAVAFMP